jgi:hypothetical protein
MSPLATLAESLGIAYASGISLYATVALVALGEQIGWIGPLPGLLGTLANPIIIGIATLLAVIEFTATLVPGIASAWEAAHTLIRTPAAAVLAVATAWHADPALIVLAGLLGGSLGLATNVTKLGLRVAVDTSPEPVSNGILNVAELGVVATLSYAIWQHPIVSLALALVLLVLLILLVRAVWRALRNLFPGGRRAAADPRAP